MSIAPIVKRELRSYFNTPVAYAVALFFLLSCSVWFLVLDQFIFQNVASLRGYFSIVPVVYLLVIPALMMRSWAEERQTGTSEILFTLPLRSSELVAGKLAAGLILIALIALLTVPLPLTLSPLGDFQRGQILGEYLGVLFLAAAGLSICQLASALSANQVSAFILGVAFLVGLTLLNTLNGLLELPLWLSGILNYLSFSFHFESFDKGLIDTRDVAYFAVVTALGMYLTTKALAARKWR